MHITVCKGERVVAVDLSEDCPVENLLAIVMADLDSNDDASQVALLKNGVDVLREDRSRTLKDCGIVDNDLLLYRSPLPVGSSIAPSSSTSSSSGDADLDEKRKRLAAIFGDRSFIDKIKSVKVSEESEEERSCRELYEKMNLPQIKSEVYERIPNLFEHYFKNPDDYDGFRKEYGVWYAEKQRKMRAIADPFSSEGQTLLLEHIRLQNVERIRQEAMDKMPEAIIPVHMLYVKIAVNGVSTFAFIDSGAQISFMAATFVASANLEHLIDARFCGIVSGIGGAQRMAGRIHCCEFVIGGATFESKVDVMNDKFDVLIGLDFMRRHRCCIDLQRNRLSFGERAHAEFLSDAEIREFEATRRGIRDTQTKVDEEKVEHIIALGFSREQAVEALKNSLNELKDAVRSLFLQQQEDQDAMKAMEE